MLESSTVIHARVVALSPHLDDVVLSIGATIHALTTKGVQVDVVTLFAGDPSDHRNSSYWDSKRGDQTGAQAATHRRSEDAAACREIGARPIWGDFQDIAYLSRRDPDKLWDFLAVHVSNADAVLLPGWPLQHADHRYATMLALQRIEDVPIAFYSELPYAANPLNWAKGRVRHHESPFLAHILKEPLDWQTVRLNQSDRAAKSRAVAAYGGEVAALGYRVKLARLFDKLHAGEMLGAVRETGLPRALIWKPLTGRTERTFSVLCQMDNVPRAWHRPKPGLQLRRATDI